MTTTALLASGTTAAASADFTVAVGTPAYLYAKPATGQTALGGAYWEIKLMKKTGSDYYMVDAMNGEKPAVVLSGAGTYQVWRPATVTAVGCDQET